MKAKDFEFENNVPYMVQDADEDYPMKRYVFVNNRETRSYFCYASFVGDRLVTFMSDTGIADLYTPKWLPKFIGTQDLATIEEITKEDFSAVADKVVAYKGAELKKYLAL